MKKENINLIDVGHVLGRSEMKKIMAGCGIYCGGNAMECTITVECVNSTICSCSGTECERTSTGCKATQSDGTVDTCDCY